MKYPLQELDGLQYRLTCAVALVEAVQECMECGFYAADGYADALYGAWDYLRGISKEMREVIDAGIQEQRGNREVQA